MLAGSAYTWVMLGLVWLFSAAAGVSFIRQAVRENMAPPARGWRRIWRELRYRLTLATGVALLLWVVISLVWVIFSAG